MGVQNPGEISYPTLPFSEELTKRLARIQDGFRELAYKGILSIQAIERLALARSQIVRLASRATQDRESSTVLRQKFTSLERLIWLAFSVFHLCTATYIPDREELVETFFECEQELTHGSQAESECLLWGGCMIATTKEIEGWELPQRKEVTEIVLNRFNFSIAEMNAIAGKFLWNESMSAGLTAVLRHRFIVVPKDEKSAEWRTWL